MVGIHLKAELPVNTVLAKLRQQGMLALSAKHNTLRLLPPLIMSEADLERGVDMIRNAIMFATND
jgi:acetylornithine aminotransferase